MNFENDNSQTCPPPCKRQRLAQESLGEKNDDDTSDLSQDE